MIDVLLSNYNQIVYYSHIITTSVKNEFQPYIHKQIKVY